MLSTNHLLVETANPRKRNTQQRLKAALLALIAELPYEQITIELICSQAGVTRKTFYNHFESQQSLLSILATEYIYFPIIEIIDQLLDQKTETMQAIKILLQRQKTELIQKNPIRSQLIQMSSGDSNHTIMLQIVEKKLQQFFKKGQQRKEVSMGFSADYLAKTILSVWMMNFYSQSSMSKKSLETLTRQNLKMMEVLCKSK